MKYKIIKTQKQYEQYCHALEMLADSCSRSQSTEDEIELLAFLIDKWDQEHNSFQDVEPIVLLKHLMEEHHLRSKVLVAILNVSKGLVSDILNCKKGLSKEIIRTLAAYFKVSQEAFNRPYKLISPVNSHLRNASVMNTTKELLPV